MLELSFFFEDSFPNGKIGATPPDVLLVVRVVLFSFSDAFGFGAMMKFYYSFRTQISFESNFQRNANAQNLFSTLSFYKSLTGAAR